MKWLNVKSVCWLEVDFPKSNTKSNEELDLFEREVLAEEDAAGAQGPQDPCEGNPLPHETMCFELLSVNTEFELNSIPQASVTLAIGRRADDVQKVAAIHRKVDDLKLQLPARIWCHAEDSAGSEPGPSLDQLWPEGKFKIFEGYVTGSAFRRNDSGAELTLGLTHWLTDMNFSSALSKQSHPVNPSQFSFPASFVIDTTLEGGAVLPSGGVVVVGSAMAIDYVPITTIIDDFWGGSDAIANPNGLKAWLTHLTKLDRITATQILGQAAGGGDLAPEKNWEACRALRRFEPDAVGPDFDESGQGYVLGVPLRIETDSDLHAAIALSIGYELGLETFESYANVTLWDKLAGQFHTNYLFSVVPLVDKALVVPFVPGLSSGDTDTLVHRTISTSQYEMVDSQTVMTRPLRAVGILIGKNFQAGGSTSSDEAPDYQTIGGYFDKMTVSDDGRYKEGLVMLIQGPRWLSNALNPFLSTPHTTGVAATVRATALNPGEGDGHTEPLPKEVFAKLEPVWDAYAHTLYLHEVLKNRQMIISGPLRFDIAPGSQIKVEAVEDRFVQKLLHPGSDEHPCDDRFKTFFWCTVLRVSTIIDCQRMRATTVFHLGHVRNEKENNDEGTSTDKHPLWQKCKWGGCVLIQDDAFTPWAAHTCES
jgi:hypothetical protein